jgi:hypothetical protein
MELDQAQVDGPAKSSKTRLSAKNKGHAVPLKQSRLSSELENDKGSDHSELVRFERSTKNSKEESLRRILRRWKSALR